MDKHFATFRINGSYHDVYFNEYRGIYYTHIAGVVHILGLDYASGSLRKYIRNELVGLLEIADTALEVQAL